jgi:leader peptidase (prepilin peptidase)/N-methyltransferase
VTGTLETVFLVYAGVLGASVGSFLNVCISRLPAGDSLVRPRSRCPECSAPIAWYDNLPLVSYLVLKGRCRHCRLGISVQYPIVEAATAAIWVVMALSYGPTWRALEGSVLLSLLLAIAITLSLGGLGAGLALSLLPGPPTLLTSALGAALGFLALLAVGVMGEWAFKKPAMGGGDMKMMALVGSFLGPAGAMLTIFLGAVAGTLIFGPVSLKTKKEVPFGVFLALGAAITFLFGEALIDWYRTAVFAAA